MRWDALKKTSEVLFLNPDYLRTFPSSLFNSDPKEEQLLLNLLHKPERTDIDRFLEIDYPWHTSGPVIKKKFLIEKDIIFDEELACHQDLLFYIQILLKNPKYVKHETPPATYIRMEMMIK